MDPLKGHMNILESLGRLNADPTFQSAAPWNLWIVGAPQRDHEKDYYKKLKLKREELNLCSHVRFLGFRNDIAEILCAADWYSQPNIEPEAFGITFIEALYAGLPVITTRMGGGQEIVGDDCGILVQPGEPESLDEALKEALGPGSSALREKLSASAPSRAKFLCDPVQQFRKLESILRGSAASE
jgi:glycosyltransferase involved in cell wall biosynthesis